MTNKLSALFALSMSSLLVSQLSQHFGWFQSDFVNGLLMGVGAGGCIIFLTKVKLRHSKRGA